MKCSCFSLALACTFFLAVLVSGHSPDSLRASSNNGTIALDDLTLQTFTGDLHAMLERRIIRVLVTTSKTHYFVDKGTQRGLTYELVKLFEDSLNKELEKEHARVNALFIPVDRDELIPALLEGRGDIAAANLTITPQRSRHVDFIDPTIKDVSEIVVTGPGAESLSTVKDLSGKEIYVRKSSSYFESLEKLNTDLVKAGNTPVKVILAPEVLETEDILEMVNAGLVKTTVADKHLADFWKQIFTKMHVHPDLSVRTGGQIGWMVRKNNPQLKAALNDFMTRYPQGSKTRNILLQRYLKDTRFVLNASSREEIAKFEAMVELFQKYSEQYDLDYLLMIAQGYQESRLDQDAKSPSGAIGVMQLLPATGQEMAVGDITKLENNIHGGVKYIRFLMDQYYAKDPMDSLNKVLFTFASYNMGPSRMSQLRQQTAARGLDPNRWFNHVEVLVAEKIGREPVQYVSNIYKYYLAYKMVVAQRQKKEDAKQEGVEQKGS